jgi:probable HAF family extracellular repeat protein
LDTPRRVALQQRTRVSFAAAAFLGVAVGLPLGAHAQSLQWIALPQGWTGSVSGVSGDGKVVVGGMGRSNCVQGLPCAQAFRWNNGVFDTLAFAGGTVAFASGSAANRDGSVVVGAAGSVPYNPLHAFRWAQGVGTTDLGVLPGCPSCATSAANAVNGDGSVVAGSSPGGPPVFGTGLPHAFRWVKDNSGSPSGGTMTDLGFLPGMLTSEANGVNADGSVVVGRSGGTAFRWVKDNSSSPSGGAMTALGFLPGDIASDAFAVNGEGSVIVGESFSAGNSSQAFRWVKDDSGSPSGGTMTSLGSLPGSTFVSARAVNGDGSVVVGYSQISGITTPFRWTPTTGMQSIAALLTSAGIDLAGSTLTWASGVSADGQIIVGAGGWIAYLPPPTLQVSPASDVFITGSGGAFTPSSFSYSLSGNYDPVGGTVDFTISGMPSWLTASFVSGTVSRTSPLTATFTLNGTGLSLPVGTYTATITFASSTGQGSQSRKVTLVVRTPVACAPVASQLADFGGDGRSDLLFRRSDGQMALYQMNGAQMLAANLLGNVGPEWSIAGSADFNGDGKADILYRRASDGMLSLYLMNGPQLVTAQYLGVLDPVWQIVGVADFNGDGRADILFRRDSDGMMALYLMDGFQLVSAQWVGAVGSDWRIRGTRDFNGDGKADILFQRMSDGMMALYLMNGAQVQAAQWIGAVGTEWNIVGVRDFNGDGKADILFRRDDGMMALYLMNGFQVLAAQWIGALGNDWLLVGLGDLNGDNRGDMVFRRADGQLAVYLMNGFQVLSASWAGALGTDWAACYGQPPATPRVSLR